jgi:hypothetical protein
MKKYYLFIFIGVILLAGCDFNYLESSKKYNLRDRGPAGGWIFYINPNAKTDGWKYLEVASSDQSAAYLWSPASGVAGTGTAIGSGSANTTAIIAVFNSGTAANLCRNYSGGGYTDWFLPSKDELYLIYQNIHLYGLGNFVGTYYCSSEVNAGDAHALAFSDGTSTSANKTMNAQPVRAVRAF